MIAQQPGLPMDHAPMMITPGHYWLQCQHSGQFGIGLWTGKGWRTIGNSKELPMATVLSLFVLGPRIPEPDPAAVIIAALS